MRIHDIRQSSMAGGVELSAKISGLPGETGDGFRMWIRGPSGFAPPRGTPQEGAIWTTMLLPVAIETRQAIEVDSPLPARFLAGTRQIMEIWRQWNSIRVPIAISSTSLVSDEPQPEEIGCFFSGGLDSCYSVLKNLNDPRQSKISHLIFVDGFDVPIDNLSLAAKVSSRIQRLAGALGLNLIRCSTNSRQLTDLFASWGDTQHGGAMAAIGHFLSGRLGRVIVPSSHTYADSFPWGSHPLVDPLWSTGALEFVHDGCEATRNEKVIWQI